MSWSEFFVGGTMFRIIILGVGLWYCLVNHGDKKVALAHLLSVAVLVALVFDRTLATVLGIPTTALVVERLSTFVQTQKEHEFQVSINEDLHSINEVLVDQLAQAKKGEQ